jgi:ActR/RegA family two-component response regulator
MMHDDKLQQVSEDHQGSPDERLAAGDWPTLDVLRMSYIHRAIEHTGRNKTRAAVLLGIDRRTLNRILARERARKAAAERGRVH